VFASKFVAETGVNRLIKNIGLIDKYSLLIGGK